jgi:hypothetical protein
MKTKPALLGLLGAIGLLAAGCNYDFALTAQPTRPVDEHLIGNWTAVDKDNGKPESMQVRRLDDSTYVVAFDDDIYRAFHSDFAGQPFLSVQNLQPGGDDRKYLVMTWALSPDASQLTLRTVSTKVVPEATKDRSALQKLILANLANPKLFSDPLIFARKK